MSDPSGSRRKKEAPDTKKSPERSLFFFHPDYTVGTGISPVHARRLADYTAGGELRPALKNVI